LAPEQQQTRSDHDQKTAGHKDASHTKTRALVLLPFSGSQRHRLRGVAPGDRRHEPWREPEDQLAEAIGLATAIDLNVRDSAIVPIQTIKPALLFGTGKVKEIADHIEADEIDLVVIDHAVTPIQQRNLEKAWNAKVLDRTGLILEIFGRRARTREGRLQVELAHLTFQRSRLVRSWTHLERQRGGVGFLGGPGETQIETDRRLLQERIDKLRGDLLKVTKTRALHRRGRRRVPYPIVAIVGYTNAGKSTLFNRLTGAKVFAKDQVFATLDPTMREVALPSGRRVILSDTVGFISDLPTMLVAAFRATLEEVIEADLILHVRDISHPDSDAQRADVENVLRSLDVEVDSAKSNIIEVWNKIDQVDCNHREQLTAAATRYELPPILTSAITGEGLDALAQVVDEWIGKSDAEIELDVPATAGQLSHWLYENAQVLARETDELGTMHYRLRIAGENLGKLQAQLKIAGLKIPIRADPESWEGMEK